MVSFSRTLLFASIGIMAAFPESTQAGESVPSARPLAWEWSARLRHEAVEDDAFARDAAATTLRLRLGARVRLGSGWTVLVEGEGIAAADIRYNSGANGRTGYPVIADPTGAELNQAWVGWRNDWAAATIGRQRVLIGNQRWVGSVGWRQNEQTFDAVALEWKPSGALAARYVWLDRVHRVNGDDAHDPLARERRLDSHVLDVVLDAGRQQWGGFVLAHDDRDMPAASTLTAGVRWSAMPAQKARGWGARMEFAQQREHADNPLRFSHDYWLAELSLASRGVTWRAGWEHLGGDGVHALQTPLATLHGFNGWADKFLVTPPGGLEDRYLGAAGSFGDGPAAQLKWAVAWHGYRADTGNGYGREWNASLAFPVHGKLTGLAKLADYRSAGFARDTTKIWLQLEWNR